MTRDTLLFNKINHVSVIIVEQNELLNGTSRNPTLVIRKAKLKVLDGVHITIGNDSLKGSLSCNTKDCGSLTSVKYNGAK